LQSISASMLGSLPENTGGWQGSFHVIIVITAAR